MKAYTKKSHVRESANDKIFGFVISLILILFAVITAIPLISEVAVSLSSKTASQMNQINLLPVGFTFDSWKYLFMKGKIWTPFLISVSSTVLGVAIALLLNVLMAKQNSDRPNILCYLWYLLWCLLLLKFLIF